MASKKFALLGINTDAYPRNQFLDLMRQFQVNWRSWADGKGGPICKKYRIEGFPTMILIDGKGVIRKKWLGAPPMPELQAAINEAMKG